MAVVFAPRMVSAAGDKVLDILRKAIMARGEVTYSAVATVARVEHEQQKSYTQLILRQKGGRERVKLQDADGQTVWLRVSDGKTLWEQNAAGNRVFRRDAPEPSQLRQHELYNLQVLSANFQVTLLGTEAVAGRKVYHIRIGHPGPPPMVIRDVWIDKGNYTELKTQRFGDDNRPVYTVAFQRVNFSPAFEPGTFEFEVPPDVQPRVIESPRFTGSLDAAARLAGFSALTPQQLPAGFSLFTDSVSVRDFKGVSVLWLQYTNGVRTFSVFQRKVDPGAPAPGSGRGGAKTILVGDYHITIVGPLTSEEFETIKAGFQGQR